MTRLFFSAGESSGDQHGAHLIEALRTQRPDIECEGLGGTGMAEAGMGLRYDLAGRAIMGFTEVLASFGFIRRLFRETVEYLQQTKPDGLVLIDYPGFNLRLAQRAHAMGIPVIYYISPQVWAWKKGRIRTIGRIAKKMLVILPFEKALYDRAGVPCVYVGHPLLDHLKTVDLNETYCDGTVIGVMPGSRAQEIERILPVMLDVARGIRETHPEARFVTPVVDEERAAQVRALAGDFPLEIIAEGYYDLLHGARFCMVASGTATVETAVFGVPMVVLYKVSAVTYWLARWLVDVDAIAMVNILAGEHVVPEFIQHEATPGNILPAALDLIDDSERRTKMLAELRRVRDILGAEGASAAAAKEILEAVELGG